MFKKVPSIAASAIRKMRENFSTRVVPMRHAVHMGKPTEWQSLQGHPPLLLKLPK